jgi:peptidoglycan/LPS O-acetylase OafA/YrhL
VPALDGLRGLAVAGVVIFHADHLLGGFLGVDLFFTLSGFLITTLLLQELRSTGGIALGHFWARRARRLLPALFALLLAVALYAVVWARPDELAQIRSDAVATLAYVANWHSIFSGHGYWDLFVAPSPFEHTWSLAIEEQFYVFWPLLVLLLVAPLRRSRRGVESAPRVLALALVAAATSSALMAGLYHPGHDPQRVYLGTDTRVSSILLGAALSALLVWRGPLRRAALRVALEVAAVGGLAVLLWAWVTVDGQDDLLYRGGFAIFAGCALLVIAAIVHPRPGPVASVLSFPPLRWLGLISYGLYLWHWPVFVVMTEPRTGLSGWWLVAARVGVSLVIAVGSYFLIEMPVRRGALTGWTIRVATPLAAGAAVLAVVLATTGAVPTQQLAGASVPTFGASGATASDGLLAPGTADTATATGAPRVLIAGDSVGYHLGESLVRLAPELGIDAASVARDGCAFTQGATAFRWFDGSDAPLDDHDCTVGWADAVARWKPDVAVVVLAGQVLGEFQIDGQWTKLCDAHYDAWYGAQVRAGIDTFTAAGVPVVFLVPPPSTLPYAPASLNQATGCLGAVERKLARDDPRVSTIDLSRFVCPKGECRNTVDGVNLRPDGLHFLGPGADVTVRWLVPRIRRTLSPTAVPVTAPPTTPSP